jgi:hypothetical protein
MSGLTQEEKIELACDMVRELIGAVEDTHEEYEYLAQRIAEEAGERIPEIDRTAISVLRLTNNCRELLVMIEDDDE